MSWIADSKSPRKKAHPFKDFLNNLTETSQMPLMDLKNLQFTLEERDRSKINLIDLRST